MPAVSAAKAEATAAGKVGAMMGQALVSRAVADALERRVLLAGDPVISEFLAANNNGLVDFEGNRSDWIEVHNPTAAPLSLEGYYLTDDPTPAGRTKWRFPAVTLPAGGYLVVFASDTLRNAAGGPLSTGFKLDADGEYLGLIRPDLSVAHEYAPTFPPQEPDVSYGLGPVAATTATLLGSGAAARARVPADASLGAGWTALGFNDSAWIAGPTGVGFEDLSGAAPGLPAEAEPNDTAATANDGSGNFTSAAGLNLYQMGISGSVAFSGDADFYNIGQLQPGDVLTLTQSGTGSAQGTLGDTYVELWRANGASPLMVAGDDDSGPRVNSLLHRFSVTTADTYFVRARAYSSGTGTYQLAAYLENTGPAPAIGGTFTAEAEPNNTAANANNAASGWRPVQYVSRTAASGGPPDYFKFRFTAGDVVTFNADSTSALDATVALFNPSGFTVLAAEGGDSNLPASHSGDSTVWSFRIPATGTYFVKVEGINSTTGSYNLQTLLSTNTPPANTGAFNGLINTDVRSQMQNVNGSAYVRVPFSYDPAALAVDRLTLRMKYDDGFVAYLNGTEIARRNAPGTPGQAPAHNAVSTAEHPNAQGAVFEQIDVTAYKHLLLGGTNGNVLAVHGLNVSAADADFLVLPELQAISPPVAQPPRYFTTPTPGAANNTGANDGPAIGEVTHTPALPGDGDVITVSTKVASTGAGIRGVSLAYRVMYGQETTVPMLDDGAHGDGRAGDGVYGATIPASASGPGQMVRWRVVASDSADRLSRAPLHATVESPEYFGTVIHDPSLTSTLPILQFFAENPGAVTSGSGTRVSVWHLGEFYDSVLARHRGGATSSGVKFDFNPGHHLRWLADYSRVDEINLNYRSNYDESNIRAALSFETFRDAGHPALAAFPMRMQLNGAFWKEATFVEEPDADFLERVGLDGNGALYKAAFDHPTMTSTSAFEKETRRDEGAADLQAFFSGIHLTGQAQVNYLFDHFDVPGFLTYWAVNTVVNDNDDVQKNYYLYRDTEGDGRWRFIAWDKDLTFGKHYGIGEYSARDPQTHPFFGDSQHPKRDGPQAWNWLVDALLDIPVVKQMYLRRLRSVMDQLLQPESTPVAQRHFENRLDALHAQLSADPQVLQYLGGSAAFQTAINNIKTRYLPTRRNHLYVNHAAGNTAYPDNAGIPAAQPATFRIEIGAIDVSPASGDQAQEYIQLTNPNAFAADVSGWTLSDAVAYTLDPGTVIPAGGSVYVAANVADFRARTTGPRGNQGLLVIGGYDGQLSARGETIVLRNPAGTTVDSLAYGANPTPAQQALRVTEIMYHPAPPPAGGPGSNPDGDEYEFIELRNISGQALTLTGARFTQGVDFTFPAMTLPPGGHVVVVGNRAAFESRYGTAAALIAGQFSPDRLNNIGERIRLEDATGEVVLDFNYSPDWHPSTDGGGRSLAIVNPSAPIGTWGDAAAWRPSGAAGGSPGAVDAPDTTPPIVTASQFEPAGPNHRVRITFSEPVTVASASSLSVSGVGGTRAAASITFDVPTRTATFTFTGMLPDGNFTATLSPAGVVDAASNAMAAGHSFALFALAGDINRDRSVNGSDFALLAGNFGRTGISFAQGDLNGDGAVNGSDFAILAGNFGRSVPPPAGLASVTALPPAPSTAAAPPPESASGKPQARRRVVPPRRATPLPIKRRAKPQR